MNPKPGEGSFRASSFFAQPGVLAGEYKSDKVFSVELDQVHHED